MNKNRTVRRQARRIQRLETRIKELEALPTVSFGHSLFPPRSIDVEWKYDNRHGWIPTFRPAQLSSASAQPILVERPAWGYLDRINRIVPSLPSLDLTFKAETFPPGWKLTREDGYYNVEPSDPPVCTSTQEQ